MKRSTISKLYFLPHFLYMYILYYIPFCLVLTLFFWFIEKKIECGNMYEFDAFQQVPAVLGWKYEWVYLR
jgi:hypothetical protein